MNEVSKGGRVVGVIAAVLAIIAAPGVAQIVSAIFFQWLHYRHGFDSALLAYGLMLLSTSLSLWNPLYRFIPNEDARWVLRVPLAIFWLVMIIPVGLYTTCVVFKDCL